MNSIARRKQRCHSQPGVCRMRSAASERYAPICRPHSISSAVRAYTWPTTTSAMRSRRSRTGPIGFRPTWRSTSVGHILHSHRRRRGRQCGPRRGEAQRTSAKALRLNICGETSTLPWLMWSARNADGAKRTQADAWWGQWRRFTNRNQFQDALVALGMAFESALADILDTKSDETTSVIELGVGCGHTLASAARQHPHIRFFAIDPTRSTNSIQRTHVPRRQSDVPDRRCHASSRARGFRSKSDLVPRRRRQA